MRAATGHRRMETTTELRWSVPGFPEIRGSQQWLPPISFTAIAFPGASVPTACPGQ